MLRGTGGQRGGREGGTEEAGRGGAGGPSPALFSSFSGGSRRRKRRAGKGMTAAASLGCHVYGRSHGNHRQHRPAGCSSPAECRDPEIPEIPEIRQPGAAEQQRACPAVGADEPGRRCSVPWQRLCPDPR